MPGISDLLVQMPSAEVEQSSLAQGKRHWKAVHSLDTSAFGELQMPKKAESYDHP